MRAAEALASDVRELEGTRGSLADVVREYLHGTATSCRFARMTNQHSRLEPDMKIKQVAEFLNLHPETVRMMTRQGKFPGAYKLGNAATAQIRIPWQTVEDYRKRQRPVSM